MDWTFFFWIELSNQKALLIGGLDRITWKLHVVYKRLIFNSKQKFENERMKTDTSSKQYPKES